MDQDWKLAAHDPPDLAEKLENCVLDPLTIRELRRIRAIDDPLEGGVNCLAGVEAIKGPRIDVGTATELGA